MKKLRFSALSIVLAMLLCTLPVSAAESGWLVPRVKESPDFADVEGSWCESYVKTVYEAGLMEGKSAEKFDAAAPLTHAQIVAVCARLHDLLTGGDGQIDTPADSAWYQGYYLVIWSLMDGKELFIPYYLEQDGGYAADANTPCTREDFVRTLSYSLLDTDAAFPALNTITTLPDVRSGSEFGNISNTVLDFYRAGILTGSDAYGTFNGDSTLNRGQAAAILARLVDPGQRVTLHLKTFDLCRDVIGLAPDTVLTVIDGMEITVEQAALVMAYNGEETLDRLCQTAAMIRLANEKGISWDLKASESACESMAGYRGVSAKGWAWYMLDSKLFELLNGDPMDPHMAADGFYDALYAEIDSAKSQLQVETTAAFNRFDFAAFEVRLSASLF